MSQKLIEKILKKLKKKIEDDGETKRLPNGDYFSTFWKKMLDPIFDEARIAIYDRKLLGNSVIQKIKKEFREQRESQTTESALEPTLSETQLEKIKKGAEENAKLEELRKSDISGNKLYKRSSGEYGNRPKPTINLHFK